MLALIVAGLAVLGPTPAGAVAGLINVPADVATIQAAIVAASTGDTVIVAPGTYHEHIDFLGKAIEVRSTVGPATTIIDGDRTSVVVVFKSGETRASVLRGFTITRGSLPSVGTPGVIAGAGIAIANASPTIIGNVITDNDGSTHAGAGIGVIGSPLIQDNVIIGNHTATNGAAGGIIAGGSAEIVGNRIENNTAGGGGGMVIHGAATVRNNIIRGNHAGLYDGGGVTFNGPGGLFVDNLVAGNTADFRGGGVAWMDTGTSNVPVLLHNTIVGNQAPAGSGIAGIKDGARLAGNIIVGGSSTSLVSCLGNAPASTTFTSNDVYNGTASPASLPYSGCANPTGNAGNISADPRFVSSTDYRLQAGSPAIDAADNAAAGLPSTDLAGAARITDGNADGTAIIDMGAYEAPAVEIGQRFHPLTPARILDTRIGLGAPPAAVGTASTLAVQVTGQGGVPSTGVSAVVLNVTVTEPTADSFLAVWPAGQARPLASNLNYVPGQTVPNLVMVKVGDLGRVNLYNNSGATHVVADVAGWYVAAGSVAGSMSGSRYTTVVPARVLDTRSGNGAPTAMVGAASSLDLQVTGRGGVPASGVSAVAINVTITEPTGGSFLTAWPAGMTRPLASNLNYVAGQTVANLVVVKVSDLGKVSLYNNSGSTHVVADVAGWFGADGGPGGSGFTSLVPARVLDTRTGLGAAGATVGPLSSIDVQVTGQGGVPVSGVSAVVLNLTGTQPTAPSFLTAWPTGLSRPLASNLNSVAGQTVPNLVVVKVGAGGKVSVYNNSGSTHIVADVAGWFSG